jgi:hypothetical protein
MSDAERVGRVFGLVQLFSDELTLAKYCQEEWPSATSKEVK